MWNVFALLRATRCICKERERARSAQHPSTRAGRQARGDFGFGCITTLFLARGACLCCCAWCWAWAAASDMSVQSVHSCLPTRSFVAHHMRRRAARELWQRVKFTWFSTFAISINSVRASACVYVHVSCAKINEKEFTYANSFCRRLILLIACASLNVLTLSRCRAAALLRPVRPLGASTFCGVDCALR